MKVNRKHIVIDVESDGPIPGPYSMVCFGVVIVTPDVLTNPEKVITFYGQTCPISIIWRPDSLAISGFSRKEHEKFAKPEDTMKDFVSWLKINCPDGATMWSDNPAYDWQFINYYLHTYTGGNPLGRSARRIGDLYCGFYNDPYYPWKRFRDNKNFPHNHNPVSDSCGNASALVHLINQGFKLEL